MQRLSIYLELRLISWGESLVKISLERTLLLHTIWLDFWLSAIKKWRQQCTNDSTFAFPISQLSECLNGMGVSFSTQFPGLPYSGKCPWKDCVPSLKGRHLFLSPCPQTEEYDHSKAKQVTLARKARNSHKELYKWGNSKCKNFCWAKILHIEISFLGFILIKSVCSKLSMAF